MMFRSVQAEDESGSDWDDITPHTTPKVERSTSHPPAASLYTPTTTEQPTHSPQQSTSHKAHTVPEAPHPHIAHSSHQQHNSHKSHHEPSQPHSPHHLHTSHQPHPSHHTSHRSQEDHETSSTTSPAHHGHTRHGRHKAHSPHITHTSTQSHQDAYPPQDISDNRLPRLLPPIDRTPSTVVPPVDQQPLTPASINPVYEGEPLVNTPNTPHNERARLIAQDNHGVLEFARVTKESARLLVPAQNPPPYSYMGGVAERSEKMSQRCTEEVVSCMRIVSDFIINFILGLLQFLLYHITRKLCCGALRIISDTVTKPLIDLCFNEFVWPISACLYQLSKAIALILTPMVNLVGTLLNYVTNMLRAFRLVDLHFNNTHSKPINV